MLEGMERAYHEGLITPEQYQRSETEFNRDVLQKGGRARAKALALLFIYSGVGTVNHVPELYLYAQIVQDIELTTGSIILSTVATGSTYLGARITGGLLRYPATKAFGA